MQEIIKKSIVLIHPTLSKIKISGMTSRQYVNHYWNLEFFISFVFLYVCFKICMGDTLLTSFCTLATLSSTKRKWAHVFIFLLPMATDTLAPLNESIIFFCIFTRANSSCFGLRRKSKKHRATQLVYIVLGISEFVCIYMREFEPSPPSHAFVIEMPNIWTFWSHS